MRALALTALLLSTTVAVPAQTPSRQPVEFPVSIAQCGVDTVSTDRTPQSEPLRQSLTIQPVNTASPGAPASSTESGSYFGPTVSSSRYVFRITNTSDREIRSVRWALGTRDPSTGMSLGLAEFSAKKKIGVGKSATVKLSGKSIGLSPQTRGTITDVVYITEVTFADGSVWNGR